MKKLLYIINVDWFFVSHFLPLGIEAIGKGYEVHLACAYTNKKIELEKLGFRIHQLNISRSGINIFEELKIVYKIHKILKSIKPDVVEFFTIKPVIYGGIVSKFFFIPKKVFYITGLGYVFISKGMKGFLVRNMIKSIYKLAVSGKTNTIITENIFDKRLIRSLNAVKEGQIRMIRGAGVDLSRYKYTQESNEDIKVVMACRLLKDKGVFEYIEAVKILRDKGIDAVFELYGDIDSENPASLTDDDIKKIKQTGYVKMHGFSSEIAKVFEKTNIVVLPSYREGLPKVLIEAAACGRAVVTTDVPGCKDAIEPDITGLLCEVKDSKSLARQIERLILDDKLRNKMGRAGRDLAEKEFDIQKVMQKHFKIYEDLS